MADRYDIQSDDKGDFLLFNEDFVYDVSDDQHIEDTINSYPGWWKENFSDGVGIQDFLNSSGREQILSRRIKIELESDLYSVQNPIVKIDPNGNLTIDPNVTT